MGRESSDVTFDQEEDEDDTASTTGPSSSSTAELQWMITTKMRKVLVNELGYLHSEVDEMEPQVCAAVITDSLFFTYTL